MTSIYRISKNTTKLLENRFNFRSFSTSLSLQTGNNTNDERKSRKDRLEDELDKSYNKIVDQDDVIIEKKEALDKKIEDTGNIIAEAAGYARTETQEKIQKMFNDHSEEVSSRSDFQQDEDNLPSTSGWYDTESERNHLDVELRSRNNSVRWISIAYEYVPSGPGGDVCPLTKEEDILPSVIDMNKAGRSLNDSVYEQKTNLNDYDTNLKKYLNATDSDSDSNDGSDSGSGSGGLGAPTSAGPSSTNTGKGSNSKGGASKDTASPTELESILDSENSNGAFSAVAPDAKNKVLLLLLELIDPMVNRGLDVIQMLL